MNEAGENVLHLVKFWNGKQRPETGVPAHAQYIVDDGSVTVNVTIKEFCVLVSRNKTECLSYEI